MRVLARGRAVFPVLGWWQTRVMAGGDSGTSPGAGLGRRWDVALSFAGAQREYVEQVAAALKARGVRYFYDADEQVELWGRHLAEELHAVYAGQAALVVMFISAEYAAGDWTRVERRAALAWAVRERREYVLPARFDDTVLPGLLDDVVAVDLRRHAPERFADLVAAKLATLAVASPGGPRVPAGPPPAGRLLAEVGDPFALEVHRPVQPEDAPVGLPDLPAYVPREHDMELGRVVRAAAAGRSGVAVLVGGSSTGKTRACWEALGLLRDQDSPWRLWHPIDPSRPDAALAELPRIGPRTVVWLNEAQFYLDVVDGGLGEQVAARLRELLRDPARTPVLVLATLWPQFWDGLTARPTSGRADPHAQARELLAGHDIAVPAAFTAPQLRRLTKAGDARLAQAAAGAPDGQVVQFLAGAPELLARYRNAPPAAAALIHAAMDARRLGMGIGLPRAFLEAATPGYLTDADWDALGEDWLEQALAYTAVPCKGVHGPLIRIRPRPVRSRMAGPGTRHSDEQLAGDSPAGPLFRLADYLDQHGRYHRKSQFPPTGFWAAAADHAFPADQAALGDAAHDRGLYRDAAQLHKNAAVCGNLNAAFFLAHPPHYLRNDVRPVRWAIVHVALGDPDAVARLLDSLQEPGAEQQAAAALLRRDPAAHASLGDPSAVANLLLSLRAAGSYEQAAALAERAATHASIEDPLAVTSLLDGLRVAGAEQQAAALLRRDPAAHVSHGDPLAVTSLLRGLRAAGAYDQAAALAERAATHSSLGDPRAVDILLRGLRETGAEQAAAALLRRDPAAHVSLGDPNAVAILRVSLRIAGADEQAAALAERAAAHVSLDYPNAVPSLLRELWAAGAADQVTALAERLPGAGMFELFRELADRPDRFRFGREANGNPARPWGWEDLE